MRNCARRALVLVPETSVAGDDLPPAWENHIRAARQVEPVKPVAVAHTVCQPTDDHFQIHPFGAHVSAVLFWC